MIPYGRQEILQQDIDAVVEVLRSDFLTQGPAVPQFEQVVGKYVGTEHALAFNSATSALHAACLALNVGPGDVVWTSPITFVASANCARYCGADVDFVDIDAKTYNIDPLALKKKLEHARQTGQRLPKVVIPVHLCGQPCDMAEIGRLASEYGFAVIEDASHAIGGRYRDAPIGSCTYSDITVFSFHPVKIITTAEGGLATTRSATLAQRLSLLRSHGITRDPALMTHAPDGAWYYQQIALGFNYRMTDVQAALGASQMQSLDARIAARHRLAKRYDSLLSPFNLVLPHEHPDGYSGLHLYVVLLPVGAGAVARAAVFDAMRKRGIGVNVHYIPVHMQPYYKALGFAEGDYPVAEDYYSRAISLPMFHHMTDQQQDQVVEAMRQSLAEVGI